MKAIFSAALVLGLCILASAADDKQAADPIGTWKCEYKIGDAKRTSELTIGKEGDKLIGAMNWPDQKDEKLKDEDRQKMFEIAFRYKNLGIKGYKGQDIKIVNVDDSKPCPATCQVPTRAWGLTNLAQRTKQSSSGQTPSQPH